MKFENLDEVNEYLKKDDEDNEQEPTFGELVEEFKGIGHNDHVYAFCDDVHLLDDFEKELLDKKISEINDDNDDIDNFLEIASSMSYYNDRDLTDDILEEIEEDKQSRGEDIDD